MARLAAQVTSLLHCVRAVTVNAPPQLLEHIPGTICMEIWLHTNRRVLLFGMIPPAIVGVIGMLLVFGLPGREPAPLVRFVGGVLLTVALLAIGILAWNMRKPRLAYHDRHLLIWLRSGLPIRVPLEVVECFLLGQTASYLPGGDERHVETSALVVRLAQKAEEWQHLEVKPQLGSWCQGYVTIRGTWCEPLSVPLVNRLNQRLYDVSREDVSRETSKA